MAEWCYYDGNESSKLIPESEVVKLISEGRINRDTLIWTQGMDQWKAASLTKFENYFSQNAPPPLPQPPNPAKASPESSSVTSSIIPPGLHWGWVFLFVALTYGLFLHIWSIVQAIYVMKLTKNRAYLWLLSCAIFSVWVFNISMFIVEPGEGNPAGCLAWLVGVTLWQITMFKIKSYLEIYYNTIENINLKLDGAMTFFFNVLYFQYHLRRIKIWKKTGVMPAK